MKVPVEILTILFLVVVVAFIVNDPEVTVPALTFIVCTKPVDGLLIVILPETDNVLVPEIVRELAPVKVVKLTDAQAAVAVTVTVKPRSIVTTSPATGTEAPAPPPDVADQVAMAFQLPVATEKRFAPETLKIPPAKTIKASKTRTLIFVCKFIFIALMFLKC